VHLLECRGFGVRVFAAGSLAGDTEPSPRGVIEVSKMAAESVEIDLNESRRSKEAEYLVVDRHGPAIGREELLDDDLGSEKTIILLPLLEVVVDAEPLLQPFPVRFLVVRGVDGDPAAEMCRLDDAGNARQRQPVHFGRGAQDPDCFYRKLRADRCANVLLDVLLLGSSGKKKIHNYVKEHQLAYSFSREYVPLQQGTGSVQR